MKLGGRVALVLLVASFPSFGQSKEYLAIQQVIRDLAVFEDRTREAQKATDEKLDKLLQQVQQAGEAASKTNTSLGGLETELGKQLREQAVSAASTGSKVDQMVADFGALREAVAAVNARFNKLEQQVADIKTALATLQAPPAPPAAGTTAVGLAPEALFQNAVRDKNGGNLQLALNGFTEYVQSYGATLPLQAAVAQYYIGELYFDNAEWGKAANAFDLVLEKYPENERTPDAHYMKFSALLKDGKKAEARKELANLVEKYPNHPLTAKAKTQLAPSTPATKVVPKSKPK